MIKLSCVRCLHISIVLPITGLYMYTICVFHLHYTFILFCVPSTPLQALSGVIHHVKLLLIDSSVFAEEVEPTGAVPIELSLERYGTDFS